MICLNANSNSNRRKKNSYDNEFADTRLPGKQRRITMTVDFHAPRTSIYYDTAVAFGSLVYHHCTLQYYQLYVANNESNRSNPLSAVKRSLSANVVSLDRSIIIAKNKKTHMIYRPRSTHSHAYTRQPLIANTR